MNADATNNENSNEMTERVMELQREQTVVGRLMGKFRLKPSSARQAALVRPHLLRKASKRGARLPRKVVAGLLCFSFISTTLVLSSQSVSAQTVGSGDGASAITGCADAFSGTLRLVPPSGFCSASEAPVIWNVEGPVGPKNGAARSSSYEGSGLVQVCMSADKTVRLVPEANPNRNPSFTDSCAPEEQARSWHIAGPQGPTFADDDMKPFALSQAVGCVNSDGLLTLLDWSVPVLDSKETADPRCSDARTIRWFINGPPGPAGAKSVNSLQKSPNAPIAIPVPRSPGTANDSASSLTTTSVDPKSLGNATADSIPDGKGAQDPKTDAEPTDTKPVDTKPLDPKLGDTKSVDANSGELGSSTTTPNSSATSSTTINPILLLGPGDGPATQASDPLLNLDGAKVPQRIKPRSCFIGRIGQRAVAGRFGYIALPEGAQPDTLKVDPEQLASAGNRITAAGEGVTTTVAGSTQKTAAKPPTTDPLTLDGPVAMGSLAKRREQNVSTKNVSVQTSTGSQQQASEFQSTGGFWPISSAPRRGSTCWPPNYRGHRGCRGSGGRRESNECRCGIIHGQCFSYSGHSWSAHLKRRIWKLRRCSDRGKGDWERGCNNWS
jgi:hypothetical protein